MSPVWGWGNRAESPRGHPLRAAFQGCSLSPQSPPRSPLPGTRGQPTPALTVLPPLLEGEKPGKGVTGGPGSWLVRVPRDPIVPSDRRAGPPAPHSRLLGVGVADSHLTPTRGVPVLTSLLRLESRLAALTPHRDPGNNTPPASGLRSPGYQSSLTGPPCWVSGQELREAEHRGARSSWRVREGASGVTLKAPGTSVSSCLLKPH